MTSLNSRTAMGLLVLAAAMVPYGCQPALISDRHLARASSWQELPMRGWTRQEVIEELGPPARDEVTTDPEKFDPDIMCGRDRIKELAPDEEWQYYLRSFELTTIYFKRGRVLIAIRDLPDW